jgi:hypothetical protein
LAKANGNEGKENFNKKSLTVGFNKQNIRDFSLSFEKKIKS